MVQVWRGPLCDFCPLQIAVPWDGPTMHGGLESAHALHE